MSEAQTFGVVVLAAGAWLVFLRGKNAAKAKAAHGWPTAEAAILMSGIRRAGRSYRVELQYRYVVNGKEYTNDRMNIGSDFSAPRPMAERRRDRYPEGSTQAVHYNPENPEDSYLEPVVQGAGWMELIGGLVAIGIGLLLIVRG